MTTDPPSLPDHLLPTIPSPCYVLEEDKLKHNLEVLQRVARQSGARILCALKGYAMWSTFPLLRKYLHGATASSLHEARLCYEEMQKKAHLCAPVYVDSEIEEIVSLASHITFNSFGQFNKFSLYAARSGLKQGIRINPELSTGDTPLYDPCTPGSRLGVSANHFEDHLPKEISGLHFHTLCEQNVDALEKTLRAVEKKFGRHLRQIQWFNMGGGHHITRKDYDVNRLVEVVRQISERYEVQVYLEPGEAVGWQTGFLQSTVQDIVISGGVRTAILDVSFSAHMPDCLEMPYKPAVRNAVAHCSGAHRYRLGGLTCLAGDFVGEYCFAEPLREGDIIIFEDMIHYTMVKSTTFNGVNLPSIGILDGSGHFRLVRSFGYQDYKGRLS